MSPWDRIMAFVLTLISDLDRVVTSIPTSRDAPRDVKNTGTSILIDPELVDLLNSSIL